MSYRVVNGCGRKPNDVMLVGEAPGREEAHRGQPFVGKSGKEQEAYLGRRGLSQHHFYRTNVVKTYIEGNPDPTPELVKHWTPTLVNEILVVRPKLVVAVGRFAARWFLGDDIDMRAVHGLPHVSDRTSAVVVPVYHPAMGLYDAGQRAIIDYDYGQVAEVLKKVRSGQDVEVVEDRHDFAEIYEDVSGWDLHTVCLSHPAEAVGVDTEWDDGGPWSIQVSFDEGSGYVLRTERGDFELGIRGLQELIDERTLIVFHNAMADIEQCELMGLDLSRARIYDTMYAAYLTRIYPQGLKPLAYRCAGMKMRAYMDVVGDAGRAKQAEYLAEVLELEDEWTKPEPVIIIENDGESKLYRPQHVCRKAERILVEYYSGKVDKDGNTCDPRERWYRDSGSRSKRAVLAGLRAEVDDRLGPMPGPGLAYIPLDDAVRYSARDADATLRVYRHLDREIDRLGLRELMNTGMAVLPIFEEMQRTGMPASRRYFEKLSSKMDSEMARLQTRISHRYYGDKPFNPKSHKQVAAVLRRRGLAHDIEKTKTGALSTGKPAIQHLRYKDDAVADIFDWRERQHIRDSFCAPVLQRTKPCRDDIQPVRCSLLATRTHTRRLASKDPNLLAIPARTDLGLAVRKGYMCPEGQVFGAWDFSQAEMRFMAHESRDPLLCQLFREGRDIHSETAAFINDIPLEEVKKREHRTPAKTTGFGILYGQGPSGLETQLRMQGLEGWHRQRCAEAIEGWLSVYSGVREYIDRVVSRTRETGVVRDHWGMYRYLPGIWADDPKIRAEAGRHAVSHKIQGGAQGMIQCAMVYMRDQIRDLQEAGLNVHWCLQVHDEVVLRFDEDLWDVVNEIVMDAMTNHCGIVLRVPIEADGAMSRTWGGLK